MLRPTEMAGWVVGAALGPALGLGAMLRRSRVIHPRGVVLRGTARPAPEAVTPLGSELARRLSGPALVRLSGSLWKDAPSLPDTLGCAIRFGGGDPAEPPAGAQDILFTTLRSMALLVPALLTTDQHDYLGNDYFAIAPFELHGHGWIHLRLRPRGQAERTTTRHGADRDERLLAAIARHQAIFVLEARSARWRSEWVPALTIHLDEPVTDASSLQFSPFRTTEGLTPRGFWHHTRHVPYRASQWARRATSG